MESYRKCFVPTCNNDSKNSSKIIVRIREDLREKWCRQVNVEYFKVYKQYCCEDHFDPKQDLANYYFKVENQEPRFKATAKLRDVDVNLPEQEQVSSGSQADESELAKLLLNSQDVQRKKRKYEDINMPSTSGVSSSKPFKVQVAVQATVSVVDKSTNTSLKTRKYNSASTVKLQPTQESSSTPVSDSPSMFSFTSESEQTESLVKKEFYMRKINLEKIYKKPKMYLGLPKQYIWLIEFIVERSSPKIDYLFIIVTLLKIKQNDTVERISDELEISRTKLASMLLIGIETLANFFINFILSPPLNLIKSNLPLVFKIRYSNVQMIIDCFEVQIAKPSDPLRQAQTWSQYKSCNTVKYLIGCTPNGLISFISEGYGGRISDKSIVEKSNLLDVLQPNAVVLADRGFKEIESLLSSRGIKLLRPPSVLSGVKQTSAEALQSKVIASLRVHVERVIRRVREYSIVKPHSVVHYKYVPYLDEIVIIACGLINLQGEIIKND